jgi:hypothetical protein
MPPRSAILLQELPQRKVGLGVAQNQPVADRLQREKDSRAVKPKI